MNMDLMGNLSKFTAKIDEMKTEVELVMGKAEGMMSSIQGVEDRVKELFGQVSDKIAAFDKDIAEQLKVLADKASTLDSEITAGVNVVAAKVGEGSKLFEERLGEFKNLADIKEKELLADIHKGLKDLESLIERLGELREELDTDFIAKADKVVEEYVQKNARKIVGILIQSLFKKPK